MRYSLFVAVSLVARLLASEGAVAADSKYSPLKVLPHAGELYFNIDEIRASAAPAPRSCSLGLHNAPPREQPAVTVGWAPGEPVQGNRFAIALMGPISHLVRTTPGPDAVPPPVDAARALLLEWARADAMRRFKINNGAQWWAVYQAFPAILIAYNALSHDGLLTDEERKTIRTWMEKLLRRTQVGIELNITGPYLPNDERINNKNTRRNLLSLLWAIETNDVKMFNAAIENGYIRFLKTLRADGSVPDANRGNWALVYTAFNVGAAMFLAEAASHQGVDLYSLEVKGQSIHTAVKFLLDGNDNPAIAARHAGANAGMADKGAKAKYMTEQDTWWKHTTDYGVSLIGWLELYVSRFPDSENTRRLLLLAEERRKRTHELFYMDWGFGNVSCFWGSLASP